MTRSIEPGTRIRQVDGRQVFEGTVLELSEHHDLRLHYRGGCLGDGTDVYIAWDTYDEKDVYVYPLAEVLAGMEVIA